MNNFHKVYTADTLKKNKIVTLVSLPMEESIMVPVSQIIDLMKQGENVLYFTFTHDSIKVDKFFREALSHEPAPENITGLEARFDVYQIPEGKPWVDFVKETIQLVKQECEINYVFFDVIPYIESIGENESLIYSVADTLAFTEKVTPIIVKTLKAPGLTITSVQNKESSKKELEEFLSQDFTESLKESAHVLNQSDFVMGIQRKKVSFWTKLINFLLFWRKRNNFTLKVLKNRNGSSGRSFRVNIDMDDFKTEIL